MNLKKAKNKAKKVVNKGKKAVKKAMKTDTAKEIIRREKLLAADLLVKAAERLRKEAKKK